MSATNKNSTIALQAWASWKRRFASKMGYDEHRTGLCEPKKTDKEKRRQDEHVIGLQCEKNDKEEESMQSNLIRRLVGLVD